MSSLSYQSGSQIWSPARVPPVSAQAPIFEEPIFQDPYKNRKIVPTATMGLGISSGNTTSALYQAAGVAGMAIGAYHGYKRNNSVGWAIGWALLGGIFPVIAIPVAFAQGIGKRK